VEKESLAALVRHGEHRWNGSPGDLLFIPDSSYSLDAVEDSAVLPTVAKRT
jgi:hypothetical protein